MEFLRNRTQRRITLGFLLVELVLYYFILTAHGALSAASSYLAIVLCFVHSFLLPQAGNGLMIAGLGCTVAADFFLVVCSPAQKLWGMVFFLLAQSLYAAQLHTRRFRWLLLLRVLLISIGEAAAIAILGEKMDALAAVSICYYANLIMNIVQAFIHFREDPLLPIGFVLFLLCDTVIGLQVASQGYLPIERGSKLYALLFMDFNLAWFFYLPSQVLISLRCKLTKTKAC